MDDILLVNWKECLPIDAPCQAKQKSAPNDDYQQATRSDDRTLRLVRMPIEACRWPAIIAYRRACTVGAKCCHAITP
jgi:hypothetical protein